MKIDIKTCLRVGLSVILVYLCIQYWPSVSGLLSAAVGAAFPLAIGAVIAYIVNILMSAYEKHYFPKSTGAFVRHSRRLVCMLAAILTLIAIVVLVLLLVLPQFISCIKLMISKIPPLLDELLENPFVAQWIPENIANILENWETYFASFDWQSYLSKFLSAFTSGIGNVVDFTFNMVIGTVSSIVTAFMALIFSVYLLLGKDTLRMQALRLVKTYTRPRFYEKLLYVLTVCNDCFRKYFIGQCTEAVILGGLCTIGMLIFRLPYATMIGALIAFTALIPVAGAYIGAGVGALMILTESPIKAVIFLVFIMILQQLEGNLIYPRVVGSSVGLPGIWVLAAVTVGGGLFGVVGMLVSVPLAASVYRILKEDVLRWEKKADVTVVSAEADAEVAAVVSVPTQPQEREIVKAVTKKTPEKEKKKVSTKKKKKS